MASRITAFFVDRRGLPPAETPAPDQPLLESGLLDSLAMMEFIAFLEQTFGVSLSDEDIVPENFETIEAVSALIESKQQG